ncbi:MAG: hypothetical protein JF617_21350, partial [Burkholderiales bacterium]|nr:hypothetical protein [Burkholderiales bacterium]
MSDDGAADKRLSFADAVIQPPQAQDHTMSIDQRRFPRVEFFLVPAEHEQLPVWVI